MTGAARGDRVRSGALALRVLSALLVAAFGARLSAQSLTAARDLVRSGKYAEGIVALQKIPRSDTSWVQAQRELAQALSATGKYDNAETVARQATAAPGGGELWNTLGEVLRERGKRVAAESAFVRATTARASDSLSARLNLAILHHDAGERDRATKEFDRFIDVYNSNAASLTSREMMAVAIACRYLGATNPQLFKDALKAFDRAIALDGDDLEPRIAVGDLFLEKYNGAEAQAAFAAVLAANPSEPQALLGAAKRLIFDGQPGADSLLARALSVNPDFVDGHVLRARGFLDIEDYAGAQREVDRALAVNPASPDALSVAAAIRFLEGNTAGYETLRERALALDPHDAEFFAAMAEVAGRIRLYTLAADFARQGVAVDGKSPRAQSLLGMNLLRLGRIDEGKASLEAAFALDPYDVWVKNTLDLLDTFKNYDVIKTERFNIMIEKDESALLSIYLADLTEAAYATFSKKYDFTPQPPIRIEVYKSHADFSVRTVGLAGLGALGVSFGTTLAFDSPAAKDAGPFNWGSTVWHELAHTFTLGLTLNRVPRWLSEGLSVHEEHLARPGWGASVSPGFLEALKAGKLVPVSRFNDGFMRPAYPEQVEYSYYEASLFCEFVARDWGEKALLAMLQEYKVGKNTEDVFQKVLGANGKALDQRFDAYLRQRFAGTLASLTGDTVEALPRGMPVEALVGLAKKAPHNYLLQMTAGAALAERGDTSEAIGFFEAARALFPEYGGADGPYGQLAHLYLAKGDARKAADMLTEIAVRNESDIGANVTLARLREQVGDTAKAAEALERSIYINPFEIAPHQHLADLYHALGDRAKVVRERRAVVALNPVDRADALYRLALAWHEAGDDKQARTSILRSLEEAPNFVAAQELLLTIVDARKP
ncbi:MAG: tetratricopeptide repeat protein [Gemmatimonadales bacterium]